MLASECAPCFKRRHEPASRRPLPSKAFLTQTGCLGAAEGLTAWILIWACLVCCAAGMQVSWVWRSRPLLLRFAWQPYHPLLPTGRSSPIAAKEKVVSDPCFPCAARYVSQLCDSTTASGPDQTISPDRRRTVQAAFSPLVVAASYGHSSVLVQWTRIRSGILCRRAR